MLLEDKDVIELPKNFLITVANGEVRLDNVVLQEEDIPVARTSLLTGLPLTLLFRIDEILWSVEAICRGYTYFDNDVVARFRQTDVPIPVPDGSDEVMEELED